jgi:hypothetical protein
VFTEDLITAAVRDLPLLHRRLVEGAFFDGEPQCRLMEKHSLKRSDVQGLLTEAMAHMKLSMQCRGIRGVADVL